jgi:hypothetical protein
MILADCKAIQKFWTTYRTNDGLCLLMYLKAKFNYAIIVLCIIAVDVSFNENQ